MELREARDVYSLTRGVLGAKLRRETAAQVHN